MTPDWVGVLIGAELATVLAMFRFLWLQFLDDILIAKMVSEFD